MGTYRWNLRVSLLLADEEFDRNEVADAVRCPPSSEDLCQGNQDNSAGLGSSIESSTHHGAEYTGVEDLSICLFRSPSPFQLDAHPLLSRL